MPSGMPTTGFACTSTGAALGGSKPETSESVVDLPQPVGPTIVTNSPAATSRVTSVMAVNGSPVRLANFFVAARSEIAGPVGDGGEVGEVMGRDAKPV